MSLRQQPTPEEVFRRIHSTVSEGQNVSFTLIAEEGYEIDSVEYLWGNSLDSTYTTVEITVTVAL